MPLHLEHLPQRPEVLDDAVVHDGDRVRAVGLRVRVAFVWPAVRRPARVRDPDGAVDRVAVHDALEHRDLALGLSRLEAVAVAHRDARRIVAAILEALEALDQQAGGAAWSNVPDNSAHSGVPWKVRSASRLVPLHACSVAERVERGPRPLDEVECLAVGWRLSDHSHDWFRTRGAYVYPTIRPRQSQPVLSIGRRAGKGSSESFVDGVEAGAGSVELVF